MRSPRLTHLQEERDAALDDLRELQDQVALGEIEPDRADVLRRRYEVAAADAIAAIEALSASEPGKQGRSRRRVVLGTAVFLLAATVVTATLLAAVEPRPAGGFATGGVAQDVAEGGGVDLSSVTNDEMEAVVAENPDIFPMRLALARRYLEDGDFSAALGHYMYVLERETNPEALMYVGWMTYVSGDASTGAELLRQSLEISPDQPLAQWFLANVLYYGTGEVEEALPLLDAVIASGTAPADIIAEAQAMVAEATP